MEDRIYFNDFADAEGFGYKKITQDELDKLLMPFRFTNTQVCSSGALIKGYDLSDAELDLSGMMCTIFCQCRFSANSFKLSYGKVVLDRVQFFQCDLSGVDFYAASITGCSFILCRMNEIELKNSYINGTEFNGCSMYKADFSNATVGECRIDCELDSVNFQFAKLFSTSMDKLTMTGCLFNNATLRCCNFFDSDIVSCDFSKSDLWNSSLIKATIKDTIFSGADIKGASFSRAYLDECIGLDEANIDEGTSGIGAYCPAEGGFIAWKKILDVDIPKSDSFHSRELLCKLFIPEDAKRSSATTYKCRCSKAKVLDITDLEETTHYEKGYSMRGNVEYVVGRYVTPDAWDDNRWNECSQGIHFFLDKEMAKKY